jgi:tetratricopeptide (TPR) repeat protein
MKLYKYKVFLLILLSVPMFFSYGSEASESGIKLFMENKPLEALPFLERASNEPGADEKVFLYLGISLQQLGRWDDAVEVFRKGLNQSLYNKHLFMFNIANSFFAQNRNSFALEYYNEAAKFKKDYAPVYLNRANTKMRLEDYNGAVEDYSVYLSLDLKAPEEAQIRQLITLLTEQKALTERMKAEEEARRLAEEQARQALIDAVARSLFDSSENTTSLSAGSGEFQDYDIDTTLD